MAMDTMPTALDMAFRTALLLTGDTTTAEAAVTHGIAACEDLSPGGLLIEAVRSAVRQRTKSSDGFYEVDGLPAELRRLFMLQPLLRYCFVLRVLVGLSPEVCAELLDISVTEFEDAVPAALTELTLLQPRRLRALHCDRYGWPRRAGRERRITRRDETDRRFSAEGDWTGVETKIE